MSYSEFFTLATGQKLRKYSVNPVIERNSTLSSEKK